MYGEYFDILGPGQPKDRWLSARRGPDPTVVLIKLFMKALLLIQKRDGQGAPNDLDRC